MPEDGKLYELVAELIIEQRTTNAELRKMREDVNRRVERLEEAQKTTNVLLRQQSRDLMKIASLLSERVVHWGNKAQVGTGSKKVVGKIIRAE